MAGKRRRSGTDVVVDGYSEQWLRRGFPWVYAREVVERPPGLSPGDAVTLVARGGDALGAGLWDEGQVAVRRFRRDRGPIDGALVEARVRAARARRPLPPETTAWRLLHGENDDMPGVRVDVWGSAVSLVFDSPSLLGLEAPLVQAIRALLAPRVVWRCQRSGPDAPAEPAVAAWGDGAHDEVVVHERGLAMAVRPWDGADAGLYCDMREIRAWLEPHWRGRRVLNTFGFTGAFTVAAAAHGARETLTVDLSPRNLERVAANLALNGLPRDSHACEAQDTFRALDALRRQGETFDLVIADPPSFSHDRAGGSWSVDQDLARLVSACLRVLRPGGWLLVATNHGGLSPKDFHRQVQKGAWKAQRTLRLLHEGTTPVDFPASLDFPESRYLKCWVLEG